jgi:hypothetical protein
VHRQERQPTAEFAALKAAEESEREIFANLINQVVGPEEEDEEPE